MTTAQQRRKKTRAERRTQQNNAPMPQNRRKQQDKQGGSWKLWAGFGSLIVAIIVAFFVFQNIGQNSAAASAISGVVTYSNLDRTHTSSPVTYAQNPPVGGAHNPVWQNCGIYTAPIVNEHAVHSMEHGAVWITYQPSLSTTAITQLQSLVRGHSYVLLSPYPGLPAPIVLSAWGVQLKVNSVSDPRIDQFISTYEQGSQTPEPGAACTGGIGTPTP